MIYYVPNRGVFKDSWTKGEWHSSILDVFKCCQLEYMRDGVYAFDLDEMSMKLNCFDSRVEMYCFYILSSRFYYEVYDVPQVVGFAYFDNFDNLEMEVWPV